MQHIGNSQEVEFRVHKGKDSLEILGVGGKKHFNYILTNQLSRIWTG
jgi:hypothetical protein